MREEKIKNWSEFDSLLESKSFRKWIFRGQSSSGWKLESSLYRAFDEAQILFHLKNGKRKPIDRIEHEKVMIDRFKCAAHLYLDHLPQAEDQLSWLSLMQHHGAPTRLLDFSFSPYIALFFALETGEDDAAVYCVNHRAIESVDDEYFGERRGKVYSNILLEERPSNTCLFAFEPKFSNQRLLSQQGLFVATNFIDDSHETILREYLIEGQDAVKIIIPAELRYEGIRKLHKLNISSTIVYPGLDGFCKSMRRQPIFGLEWQKRVGALE
ncbi:FRG domain-containing protein [Microbulbifer sp. TRSA007]|uniref:FRG domain-containing protein n=1 Tax=Microbulbifer sp. TRSA007 TaxID=3243384 RepID=UPI00403A68C4